MPDITQAVPGLLAQVHPAHTHSHDIMAYVTELEYRVSSLEQAIVGLVGGGQQKLNAQPDHAPDPFPEGEGFGGLDPLRTDDYLQQPTNLDPTQKGYGDPRTREFQAGHRTRAQLSAARSRMTSKTIQRIRPTFGAHREREPKCPSAPKITADSKR